jgi:glycosyltransferase involved in cell wall biosynthesis
MKILLIGTMPPPFGGTTVLLKLLVDELKGRQDVKVEVLRTGTPGASLVIRGIRTAWSALKAIRVADVVSMHLVRGMAPPPFIALARLFQKPVILRFFGGTEVLSETRGLERLLVRWSLHQADLTLVETKRSVEMARRLGGRKVEWYSNSRPMPETSTSQGFDRLRCRRLAYLGQICPEKGVGDVLAIEGRIPEGVRVDIYGRLLRGFKVQDFEGLSKISYRGEIDPAFATKTLAQYHALLMPTYFSGEGYPGVILEAFAAGIPVITTRWLSIPEIVDESCGILIKPRDREALASAIERLTRDDAFYQKLCAGVAAKRAGFSSRHWTQVFVDQCRQLRRSEGVPAS